MNIHRILKDESPGDRNRTLSLLAYLSSHCFREVILLEENSSKSKEEPSEENSIVIFKVNLDELDMDELSDVTRIPESRLLYFCNKLVHYRFLQRTEEDSIFNLEPLMYFVDKYTFTPNPDFDKHHFDWYKRNTVPTKVKLSNE